MLVGCNRCHGRNCRPGRHSCIMFGKRAVSVAEFIQKGAKVCVSGQLGSDNYTDKNGIEHTGFSIKVNDLELMSAKQEQTSQGW